MGGTVSVGANCQSFAYAVLRYFGRIIPEFRSRELWEDEVHTFEVATWKQLDLVLFNRTHDAFGAHVGVYTGEDHVLHLCRSVGRPALWKLHEFAALPEYRILLGAKRVRRIREPGSSPKGCDQSS
jgi:cell wall-associated NlpC family hydrolase